MTPAQTDRARGVLFGAAVGDALGAGYEFGTGSFTGTPAMIGGGLGDFAPGEWTDDTAQTYLLAEAFDQVGEFTMPKLQRVLSLVTTGLMRWYNSNPPDIGIQTARLLSRVGTKPTAESLTEQAHRDFVKTGRSMRNGSLMRTSPVALACLHDDDFTVIKVATAISDLTHGDPLAGQACALWSMAIRDAVLTGQLPDLASLAAHLPGYGVSGFWIDHIREAEQCDPTTFAPNGYVVTALQAAWSAIVHDSDGQFTTTMAKVIGIGDDTDTTASIAGALLGGVLGAEAIPAQWRSIIHGWPGATGEELAKFAG